MKTNEYALYNKLMSAVDSTVENSIAVPTTDEIISGSLMYIVQALTFCLLESKKEDRNMALKECLSFIKDNCTKRLKAHDKLFKDT